MKMIKWSIVIGVLNSLLIAAMFFVNRTPSNEVAAYVDVMSLYESFDMTKELGQRYEQYVIDQSKVSDSLKLEALRIEQLVENGTLAMGSEGVVQTMQQLRAQMNVLSETHLEMKSNFEQQIWTQINTYIEEFGQQQPYAVILGATGQGGLLYAEKTLDITNEMADFINAKYNGRI